MPKPQSPTRDNTPAQRAAMPDVVTGVQLMQGIGHAPARGFWAEAWAHVVKRRAALAALAWLGVVAFFAVYAPVLANGHPLWAAPGPAAAPGVGAVGRSPLWETLSSLDLVLLVWVTLGVPFIVLGGAETRARRLGAFLGGLVLAVAILSIAGLVQGRMESAAQDLARDIQTKAIRSGGVAEVLKPFVRSPGAGYIVGGMTAALCGAAVLLLPFGSRARRVPVVVLAAGLAAAAVGARWQLPFLQFDYADRERAGEITTTSTLVPWSPFQRFSELSRQPPGSSRFAVAVERGTTKLPAAGPLTTEQIKGTRDALAKALADAPQAGREAALGVLDAAADGAEKLDRDALRALVDAPLPGKFIMGTDKDGADVMSQLLHACRLSISIGLVSSSIALMIGVTMGALMGFFGGWIDLLLYRVVEVFMAVPVLFLLIVAVAVLPEELKTTYVIMAIIGCFTWTGMARFTRAEFMKLRNQDFVQAAQAAGLPLRSVLFRHMLPNGVAPVLVDTSFAVAAAISVEATLSYLGLGPVDSASWGKLLSSAVNSEGEFKWWLAVFPGGAIFLTVLSYNLIGEALRDAIDPKLKKARV